MQNYNDEKVVTNNNLKSKEKILEHFDNYYSGSTDCEAPWDNKAFLEHKNINRSYQEIVDAIEVQDVSGDNTQVQTNGKMLMIVSLSQKLKLVPSRQRRLHSPK